MPFIPYSCQSITDEDVAAVEAALRSEYLTQGPVVEAFERAFAERHGAAHAVSVCNATAGLHLACLALDVGPGSLVWTSPNSFLASANCARYCSADVDFVDIDPITRNMSIVALERKLVEAARQNRLPQVIIPVDFAGLPCDLREMRALADRYGFRILEDASHATGASYLGMPVGSRYSDISVFSLHAVKIITAAEGGIVLTNDETLAKRARQLRSHGMTREESVMTRPSEGGWYYEQLDLGFNYRLTDVQAALGMSQLRRLDVLHAQRDQRAKRYDELLVELPLRLPCRLPDRVSAWHLYAVELDRSRTDVPRRQIFDRMRAAGIGVNVHYIPIHTQPYYERLGFRRGRFPVAETYYAGALSLPLFPNLSDEQQDRVVNTLSRALQ